MASQLLTINSVLLCAHGAPCQPVSVTPRVRVAGAPCVTTAGTLTVAGCSIPPRAGPNCTGAKAVTATTRVRASGVPLLVGASVFVAIPSGLPIQIASPGQNRVFGI